MPHVIHSNHGREILKLPYLLKRVLLPGSEIFPLKKPGRKKCNNCTFPWEMSRKQSGIKRGKMITICGLTQKKAGMAIAIILMTSTLS
ncbi:hypothetical protein [Desulfomarina profundi]|uniref:hypothetical protein n=1 Tax=Desulfomarina profundi TaxID=2772557 RepID=UPI001E2F0365|nr:hypothetical protein [Desulfomarina profundi]